MSQSRERRAIAFWLAVSVLLGVAGQYLFVRKKPMFGYGVALYVLAIIGFIVVSVWARRELSIGAPRFEWKLRVRYVPVVLSAALLAAAMVLINSNPRTYWLPFGLWLGAIVAFVAAFVERPIFAGLDAWRARLKEHRWEILAVVLIVLMGGLLRGVDLDQIPPNIGGDEGSQGLEAVDVLTGVKTNMFVTGWLGVPNMSFFYHALWYRLFGVDVVTLRLPWAFVGTLTLLVAYLLIRRLFGARLALISTFFLGAYHYHIHFSRLGSNQIADPLFLALVLYFLTVGLSSRKPLHFALAGVALGASIYFYAGARLTFVFVAVYLVLLALLDRERLRGNWANVGVMGAAAFIVVLPLAQFYWEHPGDFNARLNMVGIIQSGWLTREVQITGRSALSLLGDQFQRAFFGFTYYKDRTVWYGATIPLMDFASAILFMLGLGLATFRWARKGYLALVLWFWMALILGGMLTESPPSSQRLVTLAVPASFFVALALQELADLWGMLQQKSAAWRNGVIAVVLAGLAVIGTHYYFVKFTPLRAYGSLNGEVATEVGYYLQDLGPGYRCYFFGPPRIYYGFATIPYLSPETEGIDVLQPLSGPPDFVLPDKDTVFIFVPERLWEWQYVREKYPGGTIRDFVHADSHELLFTAYEVPRQLLAEAAH